MIGRLVGIAGGKAQYSGSLKNPAAMADLKMNRLLDRVDAWASANGLDDVLEAAQRYAPTRIADTPATSARIWQATLLANAWRRTVSDRQFLTPRNRAFRQRLRRLTSSMTMLLSRSPSPARTQASRTSA